MTNISQESNRLYLNSTYGQMTLETTPEGVVVEQQSGDHRQPDDPMTAILDGEAIATLGGWLNELTDGQCADIASCMLRSRRQKDIHRVAILVPAEKRHNQGTFPAAFDQHLQTVGLQYDDERGIAYAAHAYGRMLLEVLPNQGPLPSICSRWLGAWISKELAGNDAVSGRQ